MERTNRVGNARVLHCALSPSLLTLYERGLIDALPPAHVDQHSSGLHCSLAAARRCANTQACCEWTLVASCPRGGGVADNPGEAPAVDTLTIAAAPISLSVWGVWGVAMIT